LIAAHFPAGASNPVEIIAAAPAAGAVAAAAQVPGISQVLPAQPSEDGRWVRIQAILADEPSSAAAKGTIDAIRDSVHRVPGGDALVGGQTAILVDTENASDHDNKVVLPLILLVVFVVLVLLLRALVAPLLLVASVVLSFGASMGIATLIYRGMGHPRIDLGLPLLAFLFLVALGVDYTIFLMTRAREETVKLGHQQGIQHSLAVTGGVITSAGLVLAATFAVLTVLPLVTMLQLGLVVALGVLLDTLVVRTLLVPAVSLDTGPRIWWPSSLSRQPLATQATADRDVVRTGN
jgi:RND superfamily putative drug exporter